MNEYVKEMFTRFGALLPARAIYNLNAVASYLETGRWMRAEGYSVGRRVRRREDLFDQVAKAVADRVVLYLEFGVYKMRHLIGRNGCAIPVVDSTALIPLRGYPKIGFSAGNEAFFQQPVSCQTSAILVCASSRVGSIKP